MMKYFAGSLWFTVICLGLSAVVGYEMMGGTTSAVLATVWICLVLAVLEISLSFDNAVVNATVLKDMEPIWQKRFLTWGMLIAVFGMRIVFPVMIVSIAAWIGPIEAVSLAIADPEQYKHIIEGAHGGIMGFGGSFLLLVGFKFFFDADKEHDWIALIEAPLRKFADLEAFEIILTLVILYLVSDRIADPVAARTFLISGILGIATFFAVEWLGKALEMPEAADGVQKGGLGAFLYLQVIDASFSFDGVIGAFALSSNLFVIALGLAIGAMFVRSMTLMLVAKGTLSQYRYLEHGAFWAIIALALIMLTGVLFHIPETVTGVLGAVLIGLSFYSSVRHNRAEAKAADRA